MPVFQGVAPQHTFFTSSCVISLWDSATAHSPSGKELKPSSQEDVRFSGHCTLAYIFHFILRHLSLGLTHPSVKRSNFPLLKNHVSQGLLFVNVLTLSCLGSLWFATHPYYSLNPYVNLYYLWSISKAKDRRFAEKCSLRLWWNKDI